jgi:hydroxymethylbilane synthase
MQILRKRPDLDIKDLRGNVNTRLRKLADGEYDAIILAYIGLSRLDLLKDIPYVQKLDFMIPPMGQAALGIEIVEGNTLASEIASSLDDRDTHLCTDIERDFISAVGAGCSAPVAVNARIRGDIVETRAMLGMPDGTEILYEESTLPLSESAGCGRRLAEKMISDGALELLKRAEEDAFKEFRPDRI